MSFKLPDLSYDYDALEPHIDARTMEIHHSKHHAGYVTKLNAAIEGTELEGVSLEEILSKISRYSTAVRNNGGGHYNHSLFWKIMSPNGGGQPDGELAESIKRSFGSFDDFKSKFSKTAATHFGSGWAWLGAKDDGDLCICSTPNQDNPLMDIADCKCHPILGIDVWEHAYYLHYQNRRPDYIAAWWNLIDWTAVAKNLSNVKAHESVL